MLEVRLCSVFKLLKVIQTDILKGKQLFETRCALYVNQTSLQYLYSMLSVCLIRGKCGKDKSISALEGIAIKKKCLFECLRKTYLL